MAKRRTREEREALPTGYGFRVTHADFASAHLGTSRTLTINLPPGYDDDMTRRYPVLYLHDGQNLFEDHRAAYGVSWRAGEIADRLTTEGRIRPILLVGIDNSEAREDEYAVYPDDWTESGGRGDEHARFVVEEVKPFVDREYRTLPGRADTAIAGSSMGGLASLTTAWHHPGIFGMCAMLSPSLWWAKGRVLDELADDSAWMRRTRFWLCMGTHEEDPLGQITPDLEQARRLVEVFDGAGLIPGRDYRYWEVAGGEHNEAAWSARFDKVLLYFFGV
jgi:predicted alpha/beta superfamily hydrolase